MTGKADFSEQEWKAVLEGPPSAAMIVMMAQRGGTFRETIAMAKGYAEARQQHGESELLDELVSAKPEVDHTRYHSAGELTENGMQHLRDAIEILERKATPEGGIGALWARVERKLTDPPDVSQLFERPTVKTYPWLATYDTSSYLDMLASQSSYALIETRRRNELLAGIGQLIDERLAGVVTKQYVTILAIAVRA